MFEWKDFIGSEIEWETVLKQNPDYDFRQSYFWGNYLKDIGWSLQRKELTNEGRKLLINESTVYLIYSAQITDVNELDVLLRETISAGLASDISYAITANLQVTKLMTEKYGLKLSEARHTDASEGYNTDPTLGNTDQIITEDFINSRY